MTLLREIARPFRVYHNSLRQQLATPLTEAVLETLEDDKSRIFGMCLVRVAFCPVTYGQQDELAAFLGVYEWAGSVVQVNLVFVLSPPRPEEAQSSQRTAAL